VPLEKNQQRNALILNETLRRVANLGYDGKFRVPANCRIVCALAIAGDYGLSSETIRIPIPQNGKDAPPPIDLAAPARWTQQTKLDDASAVWDFLQRLEASTGQGVNITAHDISLTAESADGQQSVDYSGSLEGGYAAAAVKTVAERLQEIVSSGSLRMSVGSLAFPTGQALLDWLRATNQPFNAAKVVQ
jgi:hypothetical protein